MSSLKSYHHATSYTSFVYPASGGESGNECYAPQQISRIEVEDWSELKSEDPLETPRFLTRVDHDG